MDSGECNSGVTNSCHKDYTVAEGGVAAVPEPGTIVMLLLAGLTVLGWRRR